MKLVISDYETGEIYEEVDDLTATQIASYTGSDIIIMDEEEWAIQCRIMEHNNQILNILVSKE